LLMNMAHVTDRMRCGLGPVLFPPRGINVLCASDTTLIGLYTGILDRSAFFLYERCQKNSQQAHLVYLLGSAAGRWLNLVSQTR
jgi:hypothetical protein